MKYNKLVKLASSYENLAFKTAFEFKDITDAIKSVDYNKWLEEIKDYIAGSPDPKKKENATKIEQQLQDMKEDPSKQSEWSKLLSKFKEMFHVSGTVSSGLGILDFKNPIKSPYHNIGAFNVPHIKDSSRKHMGVDLAAPRGTPVYASAPGIVYYIGSGGTSGNIVQVKHENDYKTFYMHLDSVDTKVNDKVDNKTVIGKVGDTGNAKGTHPHLLFEVRKSESPIDPASVGINISSPDIEFMKNPGKIS